MSNSWRLRMGMPSVPPPTAPQIPIYPPRRSTEESTSSCPKSISGNPNSDPEDFSDVFGGPPRTILSRQFSTGFPTSSYSSSSFSYEEIFRPLEKAMAPPVRKNGRSLPQFAIPGQRRSGWNQDKREDSGFYDDIFGLEDEAVVRSRSRSKTSSSSILSPEEFSPIRPAVSGDDFACFASKLRPINVRSRWAPWGNAQEDYQRQQNMPPFAVNQPIHRAENDCHEKSRGGHPFGLNRRNPSPETISVEPISNDSFGVSADDLEHNSPVSAVSSVSEADKEPRLHIIEEQILRQNIVEEDDDLMSSYVIEINSDNKDGICEPNGVDEAIAWAKEKFQTHCPVQECEKEKPTKEFLLKGHQISKVQTDTDILDEKIRLWSIGKEADIRLLLSSLHHVVWPDSGWLAIPLANLIEVSQVKKAYQKARLFLHPDKLQQRGATLTQKYIAEKLFSVLQEAWGSFVSPDAFLCG